jgi:putative ABC transport system substrate-binding protein
MVLEYRWTEGDFARLPALAADLVRRQVDLILARSSQFVQAAKEATTSIPIVFVVHANPVGTGHVASLARPGGNVTGLAVLHTDLSTKRLEILSSAVPEATRKGAHRKFTHVRYAGAVTLSGQTGDDAKPYQERQVKQAIEQVRQ